jgi:hypothetical protein
MSCFLLLKQQSYTSAGSSGEYGLQEAWSPVVGLRDRIAHGGG